MNPYAADAIAARPSPNRVVISAQDNHPAETVRDSVQPVQNSGQHRGHPPAEPNHGLPERTVAEISTCLHLHFPQLHWVKLYGSRAMGRHRLGSDIDLAFSANDDCSAALREALDELPTPYLFDVTHWESLRHSGLREHIQRVGIPFPDHQQ